MIEFVEYRDEKIRIKLPKQLRQKRPIRFFQGNLVRGKPETQITVGIDVDLNTSSVKATREVFLGTRADRPVTLPEWYKVLRSGPCSFGEKGLELFTSSEILDKGYILYAWDILCRMQGRYVMLTIMGGGSREDFESMAKEIITSLRLLSPSQSKKTATGSTIKRIKNCGLKAREKARLARTLKSLPEDLKYLRDPILAIADEDQDLLGSGGVDTTLLAEAIENQAELQQSGFATNHSKKLEKWFKSNASKNDKWAGPVWFVMAFLMGYDLYKDEDAESTTQSLTKRVKRFLDAAQKL